MPTEIASNPMLELMVRQTAARMNHHAKDLLPVYPVVLGFAACYGKDFKQVNVNLASFVSKKTGKRYTFGGGPSYAVVEIRAGSMTGAALHTVHQDMTLREVWNIFNGL